MNSTTTRSRLCNPKPFKDQFRRDTKERKERRYCFILGAGTSVSSGIPSGSTLAGQWLRELYERECPSPAPGKKPMSIEEWCVSGACPVPGIDAKNPAKHYPQLFLSRYPGRDPEGQRFIQEAIRGLNPNQANLPSVGYAYLALLLQQTDSRVVITTNFDNLAADALLLFTGSLPRVVGHERVANFAGLRDGQPLIAKIHGDVGFVTTNDPAGVSTLPPEWSEPLRNIFRDHIPIVIGYDGNDGSLMDFLSTQLFEPDPGNPRRSLLSSGLYWCYRAAEGQGWEARLAANKRLQTLTAAHQVHFVPISDFDLWMMELGEACGVGDPEQILRDSVARRVKTLTEQVAKARTEQSQPAADPAIEASRVETREEIGKRHSEWDWIYKAQKEADLDKADAYFLKAIEIAPDAVLTLGSYASFLADQRKDYERAEEFYQKALAADPNNGNILGNYALFLEDQRMDCERVEKFYQKALAANPNHANNLCNYASFLKNQRKNYERAEEFYQKALATDPNHANNLGSYANFLAEQRRDYERAEEFYQKALAADPNHANNLCSYAKFLADQRQDYERAEEFYQKALAAEPNNAKILGNYALFVAAQRKDYERADDYYHKALDADPNYPANLGNYGEFLILHRTPEKAGEFLRRAGQTPSFRDAANISDAAAILWMTGALRAGAGEPTAVIVGALKTVVMAADYTSEWSYDALIAWAQESFSNREEAGFWIALARVCGCADKPATLDGFPQWREAAPVPLEAGLRATAD